MKNIYLHIALASLAFLVIGYVTYDPIDFDWLFPITFWVGNLGLIFGLYKHLPSDKEDDG